MNQTLRQQTCLPCSGAEPPLTPAEVATLQPQVPDWAVVEEKGMLRLRRTFLFPDFVQALAFTQQVGELAEAQGHHPVLRTEWGKVTVTWWTRKIKGLHHNDFIMAAKTDTHYAGQG